MTTPRSPLKPLPAPDADLLSAYLDEQLHPKDRAALETRLEAEPELRLELEAMRRTIAVLRAVPEMVIPRSFLLDPTKYHRSVPYWSRYGTMRVLGMVGTAAAAFMIIFGLLIGRTPPAPQMSSAASPPLTEAALLITGTRSTAEGDKRGNEGYAATVFPTAITQPPPAGGMVTLPTRSPVGTPTLAPTLSAASKMGGDEGRSPAATFIPAPAQAGLEPAESTEAPLTGGAADALLAETETPRTERARFTPSPPPSSSPLPAIMATPSPVATSVGFLVAVSPTPTPTVSAKDVNPIRRTTVESELNPSARLLMVIGLGLGMVSIVVFLIAWLRSRT